MVFINVPEVNVPFTPDSLASGQPSPSLSKSKLLTIPSLSISQLFKVLALQKEMALMNPPLKVVLILSVV